MTFGRKRRYSIEAAKETVLAIRETLVKWPNNRSCCALASDAL